MSHVLSFMVRKKGREKERDTYGRMEDTVDFSSVFFTYVSGI